MPHEISHEISHSPNPVAAYVAAYAMGRELRQKVGAQDIALLARDHVETPYRANVHYEQIVRGFTRGYLSLEAPSEAKDAGGYRN
jgi:hypothetical protein